MIAPLPVKRCLRFDGIIVPCAVCGDLTRVAAPKPGAPVRHIAVCLRHLKRCTPATAHARKPQKETAAPQYSKREAQVVALLCAGRSRGEIARQMGLHYSTVRFIVERVLLKSGAATVEEFLNGQGKRI